MMTTPNVSVIILNWNGVQDTIECLDSLLNTDYPCFRITILDNGSTDGSVARLLAYIYGRFRAEANPSDGNGTANNRAGYENLAPSPTNHCRVNVRHNLEIVNTTGIDLLASPVNLGFSEGNNVAMKYVICTHKPEYVLLLNNDTVVHSSFMKELVTTAETDKKIGFAGPMTYRYGDHDGRRVIDFAGGKLIMWKGQSRKIGMGEIDHGQFGTVRQVDYVEGSCLLARCEMIEQIGYLNPDLFAYWEESDWCLRGFKAGYISVCVPRAMIWHKVSASGSRAHRMFYIFRNMFWFVQKYASRREYCTFLVYFLVFYVHYKSLIALAYHRDLSELRSILAGTISGIFGQNRQKAI